MNNFNQSVTVRGTPRQHLECISAPAAGQQPQQNRDRTELLAEPQERLNPSLGNSLTQTQGPKTEEVGT